MYGVNPPFCPTCGAPGVWKPEANGWGCDRCRQMLPNQAPPPMQAAPVHAAAIPAGGPLCPRCGTPSLLRDGRWGCDRCRAFLDQMGAPGIPAGDPRAAARAIAGRRMAIGLVLVIVGIAITAGTYNSASARGGGTYFIAYGPIIVGAIRFFQGLFGMIA